MEITCGEFDAANRRMKSINITLQKYLDFIESHKQLDLTINFLNQILSIHGFRKLHKAKKEELIDAVNSIELMDLTRSTLKNDLISSCAFISSEDAIKDLKSLNWIECSVTSFKTLNSANYDLVSLQNANSSASKSSSRRKKPQKMRRLMDETDSAPPCVVGDHCTTKGNNADVDRSSSSSMVIAGPIV